MNDHEFDASSARQRRASLALGLVGLAFFLGWQALGLRGYIRADTRPPSWDQSNHLEIALDYRDALRQGRWTDALYLAPKPGMPPFPPLYHLALMQAYDGPNPAGRALWVNWFYLAVLCVSIFAIAFEFNPDSTALAAAVIFACAPEVQWLLTNQLIDLAVAACAAAAYWALLRSEGFKHWPASLAFGLLFAVGMLHKWSFFSYMLPAYYMAYHGLASRESRPKILAAAAVALAGSAPWYLAHLPILLPRLVSASADVATPVWKGGAFFEYFLNMSDRLGPPFWVLGTLAILAPQFRERKDKGWVLQAWVATSYLFWAVVPNRQMRFLLPGLPALAVVLGGAWPKPWVWLLAGYQAFAGANYLTGWVAPVNLHLPVHNVVFLPSEPPAREDWPIAAILKEAQRRSPPDAAVADLTLVANAVYFNGSNFAWMDKLLGLPTVRVRGVNSRLCEFSRFVVLKTGKLGPPGVIEGLPKAADAVREEGGWFQRAYREAARFPLPDGSQAVLFEQRRFGAPPFQERTARFAFYDGGAMKAEDFKVDTGRWDADRQAYPKVEFSAAEASLRGLKIKDVSLELDDALLVPVAPYSREAAWDDVRFLKLGALRFKSARVDAADLARFLESRVKGLKINKLVLDGNLKVSGTFAHLALTAEASAKLVDAPRGLRIEVVRAAIGTTPLPLWLLGRLRGITVSFAPNPETPFAIDAAGLTVANGRLSIP